MEASELRRQAENSLKKQFSMGSLSDINASSPEEIKQIIYELQVHQIELEMQNEEMRRAQEEKDRLSALYFDLYDLAPVGYVTISEEGLILEANLTAATLLGIDRARLLRQPVSRFIFPEDQDTYYHKHRKPLLNSCDPEICEVRMMKQDGTTFWVNLKATATQEMLARSLSEQSQQESTCRMLCRLVIIDITELKEAQKALAQAQKMESIGRLAGGIAHDFNNMLMVILGNTEISLDSIDPDNVLHDNLIEIHNAAKRSADLTRQLLAFARRQSVAPVELDLNQTVERMLKMLRRLIGEDIELVWIPGDNLWSVKIDPSQIDQILANLCTNARDAIDDVGKVVIAIKNSSVDKSYCSMHMGAVPGDYVKLSFSDNGCGMDNETLNNIFEPFFTTKGIGKGTGLGLATIYGIVKQNLGFIRVHSEQGEGTAFDIYLPRYAGQSVEMQKEGNTESVGHGDETILLVEDELAILKLSKILLERLGYTVLAAETSVKAMNMALEHTDKIHLLMTDVIMPGMNGKDLARNIKGICANIRILFMSGYTAEVISHYGVLEEGVYFIQKPFTVHELAFKLKEVMKS